MNEGKIKKFLKLRSFFSIAIVLLYLLHRMFVEPCENCSIYYLNAVLFISAIFILINNHWIYRILICLNVLALMSDLYVVIVAVHYAFGIGTLNKQLLFLLELDDFRWNVAFCFLQISLIIYLITVEIKVYKNKNSLV